MISRKIDISMLENEDEIRLVKEFYSKSEREFEPWEGEVLKKALLKVFSDVDDYYIKRIVYKYSVYKILIDSYKIPPQMAQNIIYEFKIIMIDETWSICIYLDSFKFHGRYRIEMEPLIVQIPNEVITEGRKIDNMKFLMLNGSPYPHPHINADSHPCLGDSFYIIKRAAFSGRYEAIFIAIRNFLKIYTYNDSYERLTTILERKRYILATYPDLKEIFETKRALVFDDLIVFGNHNSSAIQKFKRILKIKGEKIDEENINHLKFKAMQSSFMRRMEYNELGSLYFQTKTLIKRLHSKYASNIPWETRHKINRLVLNLTIDMFYFIVLLIKNFSIEEIKYLSHVSFYDYSFEFVNCNITMYKNGEKYTYHFDSERVRAVKEKVDKLANEYIISKTSFEELIEINAGLRSIRQDIKVRIFNQAVRESQQLEGYFDDISTSIVKIRRKLL